MQKGSSNKSDTKTTQQYTESLGGGSTSYAPWIGNRQQELNQFVIGLMHNEDGTAKTPDKWVAPLNPDQQAAFQYARGTAGQFGAGSNNSEQFQGLLGKALVNPTDYREHMNPYLEDVGRAAINDMRREHENTQAALSARYAARGGLGGSGEGFARARLARGFNEAVPGVVSNILSAGYDRAQSVAAQNAQNALAAAGLLDRHLTSELDRQTGAAGLLGQAGATQYAQEQRLYDAPYDKATWLQTFVPQVYDYNQSTWNVQDMNSTEKSQKASPSLMQQLLGLGGSILTSKDASGGTVGGSLLKSLLG